MIRSWLDGLTHVVAPPKCCLCYDLDTPPICSECDAKLVPAWLGGCPRCGTGPAADCPFCIGLEGLDGARAAYVYEGAAGLAVRRLKFHRLVALGRPMSERMLPVLESAFPDADLIVPVPMHRLRMAMRGFNQSELLCSAFPQDRVRRDALFRIRYTRQQARLRGKERALSLRGAFRATPEVAGRRVLLVDDVMTTGATLRECADTLRSAGAVWVGALTFARELPGV
ncbi:MAG: amidophosphoribosyltransferase [Fimbriimonadales bacterium]|nr:MAG: amidophosphoribosyltransferase [Fimbriimonadales bacterium]